MFETSYQLMVPWRSIKVPVGPSAPMVASSTMASVPRLADELPRFFNEEV